MKKRIIQLAEQAGYQKDMFGVGHWNMPECKNFAKLIVQECINNLEFHGHDEAVSQLEWLKRSLFWS